MSSTSPAVDGVEIELCFCQKYYDTFSGDIVEWTVVCKLCREREQKDGDIESSNVSETAAKLRS